MHLRAPCAICGLLLLIVLPLAYAPAAFATPSQELWYGVFLSGQKIGHAHFWTTPTTFEGRSASQTDSQVDTKMAIFGISVEQQEFSRTVSDAASGAPLSEDFTVSSGGETTEVTARFFPTYIDAKLTSGKSASAKRIPIPPGTKLTAGDTASGMDSKKALHVGQSQSEVIFNPLTLSLQTISARVLKEGVSVYDPLSQEAMKTWQVHVTSPDGDQTIFQDQDGDPIRISMSAGLIMLREGQQVALAGSDPNAAYARDAAPAPAGQGSPAGYRPSADLAVATAVDAGGAAIDSPRTCRHLSILVTEPDTAPRTIDIQAVAPPDHTDMTVAQAAQQADLHDDLADAPYLNLQDPEVEKLAQEIRGTRTNLYDIVVQIHNWVNSNMTPNGTLGLPRSAPQICADRRGVCRDYAVLYTALARAAGVPTKLCAGIVAFDGRFYYHAWAESYVGNPPGWLPVDPTMPQMFVDATHVPLAKGDPTALYTLGGDIGGIKAQVLAASQ